ncbi:MAG: MtrB/PioB family decaheme-associated outer membrane protein [Burkholderiaceae bacterium]|nr:MtrB/PioB family decaheme-associated outer membrane protein [Burkholderiaceae bacterium]
MKTSKPLLLISLIAALPTVVAAADVAVDTSEWKCESCEFVQGRTGSVDVGAGAVSQSSAKFGQFNGLGDKGGFLIGGANVRGDGENGAYWSLKAADLGIDARSLSAEAGTAGRYRMWLRYNQLPALSSDSASTPFLGSGTANLTLPAGYPAATTALMPLGASLQSVAIGTERKRLDVGALLLAAPQWEYSVNVRHEVKDGTKRGAGSFFVQSSQFLEPVDHTTNQVEAYASYAGSRWQMKLGYYGSLFRNGNQSLTWANPFTPVIAGSDVGILGLPPDSDFHQLSAALGYRYSAATRLNADVAVGRMTQNQSYQAQTTNDTLSVDSLPATSLNGRVATVDASLRLNTQVNDDLRLNAAYTHNDRDNQTASLLYPSLITDMFNGVPRSNLPFSFTKDKLKLRADYRINDETGAAAGYDHDTTRRTYQEVDRTRDQTVWGRLSSRAIEDVELSLRAAHGERRNSGYQALPQVIPPENPLMRKYNLANRKRDTVGLRADMALSDELHLGLGLDAARDDYQDSTIGLTDGRELTLSGDASWAMSDETRFTFFVNRQQIRSTQAGSSGFSTPDWTARNRDTVDFIGVGVKHVVIEDKLNIGADLSLSRSKGDVAVFTGISAPPFPTLTSSVDSLRFYAVYQLRDNITLRGDYGYERYRGKSWLLDGVLPATIENVLTLGQTAPDYRVHLLRMSLRYSF